MKLVLVNSEADQMLYTLFLFYGKYNKFSHCYGMVKGSVLFILMLA